MNNATTGDSTEAEILPEETAVRTAAFLADAHTSTFLLGPTIQALVTSQKIQSAVIDLSTETGISIANLLVSNPEVEYRIFDTVPLESTDALTFDLGPVLAHSAGTVPFNAEDLNSIDANIVLLPAAAIDAGPGIDVSDGTIAGAVISRLQQTNTNCMIVLPPESGLRKQEDGNYVRLTLKLEE